MTFPSLPKSSRSESTPMSLPTEASCLVSTVSVPSISEIVRKLTRVLVVVAMPQWSQSAYRHGDFVAKYGVFPLGEEQKKIENEHIKDDDPINCISQFNRAFHSKHKVTYSFCAQLLQNLDEQPVDDIGVEWDAEKYPMEQVSKRSDSSTHIETIVAHETFNRSPPSSSSRRTRGYLNSARGGTIESRVTRGTASKRTSRSAALTACDALFTLNRGSFACK